MRAETFDTPSGQAHRDAARIGAAALGALLRELAVTPKPGLVTLKSPGSHTDMDAATFLASIQALKPYFTDIAHAGHAGAPFALMRRMGLDAERRMMAATGGVNTHRGAIFALGVLAAAAGHLLRHGKRLTAGSVTAFCATWRQDILAGQTNAPPSHGLRAAQAYGVGGARLEAAAGFPSISAVAWPAYRDALRAGACWNAAAVQTLFALMAHLDDTNLLHRGGRDGADFAKSAAQTFLAEGGVAARGWRDRADAISQAFVARRLSPGGSADLLAATLFLVQLERLGDGLGARPHLSRPG